VLFAFVGALRADARDAMSAIGLLVLIEMRRVLIGFFGLSVFVMLWSVAELFVEGRSLLWRDAPAKVTRSEVRLVAETQSTNRKVQPINRRWYSWDLEYTYRVDGLDYRSDRASLLDTPIWNKTSADAMAAKYPVGADLVAYVSPDDPALAVLEPGFSAESVTLMLSSILASAGAVWMLRGTISKPARRSRITSDL
jgi:hypothetical protein